MDLTEYLKAKGGTAKPSCPILMATALRAGCSKASLYQIALGLKAIGPKLAGRIEAATDGKVTRAELRAEYFGPVKKRKKSDPTDKAAAA